MRSYEQLKQDKEEIETKIQKLSNDSRRLTVNAVKMLAIESAIASFRIDSSNIEKTMLKEFGKYYNPKLF